VTMRVRWRDFELPSQVKVDTDSKTDTFARFVAEPFEHGFGTTVGNSLRRILIGSLEGAAVISVRFDGLVLHEYSTIEGMFEEVTDVILNLKNLLIVLTGTRESKLTIDVRRPGPITAADIQHDHTVEIINKNMHIATLAEEGVFKCEITVRKGRGYHTAGENQSGEQEIGLIPVASFFSPVRRVKFRTENTRVGQLTNYDKLLLEISTDGTVSPESALVEAAKILRKHLNPFVAYFDVGRELNQEFAASEIIEDVVIESKNDEVHDALMQQLMMPIAELDLSVRASNCLEAANIATIGALCQRTDAELLKLRQFGKTTLKEIGKKLAERDLHLGMDIDMDLTS
jgi:DNA-directed RNA polymerase subunit alpha